ncbi:MAG: 16S rRNA (cytosine(1402)-N(4))-methyltransferase RsmH [Lentisphaeria bacterium]|nr:16S rRNA (cytosine(1402)-N(4))-methyltransferase RsmH [Lentisphaeria bacterium]
MSFAHIPVLPEETIRWLNPQPGGRYIDGTVGGGGHARLILAADSEIELLGIDRDTDALAAAKKCLAPFEGRVHLRRGRFSDLAAFAEELGWEKVDGLLLDVGVSSHQIDSAIRGFSFRQDGPLDMRMDRRQRLTAATILNSWNETDLKMVFRTLGEEPRAGAVARAVIRRREQKPFSRTVEFAELLEQVADKARGRRLPPPTRCFQALRIAVNGELDELEDALAAGVDILKPGGRLVVISFHSLEDRIVKNAFRDEAKTCVCPPDFPVCRCGKTARLKVLTRKPVTAGDAEIEANSRSGCARLRAAERL